MEDSQIAALPPDLAAEAQNLRREWESRNRHMQDRFFTSHPGQSTLSQILRSHQAASGSREYLTKYLQDGHKSGYNKLVREISGKRAQGQFLIGCFFLF